MSLGDIPKHENTCESDYDRQGLRGMEAVTLWSSKPATQSGSDIVANPKWSPRFGESTQGRVFHLRCPPAQEEGGSIMEEVYACCAGLDVHKESVEACVRRMEPTGGLHQQTRHWGTMTQDLRAMADWMAAQGVTHVAMESTGVYWKPIYNLLESRFTVLLVNARHLKQVPGRKSDIRDCQWIAQLLQHGLLKGSFIPPRAQRELRDLTRHRTQLVEEKARTVNRIHKVLEDANIKLASVASDILGVSGRAMLQALIEGQHDAVQLADLAQRQLRGKIPELEKALEGQVTAHHRFMLQLLWKQLAQQEEVIAALDVRIEEQTRPFADEIERLDAVPGVDRRVAQVVLAEVGAEMKPFPSAQHLASWAGMCPGNEESAGKRLRRSIPPGNRWLKRTLVQAAWAATHARNSYLAAQYRRLAGRRGRKRALVAVGHSLLVIFYHMLKARASYADLGGDFFDRLEPQRLTRYYLKRLEALGHKVTLESSIAA